MRLFFAVSQRTRRILSSLVVNRLPARPHARRFALVCPAPPRAVLCCAVLCFLDLIRTADCDLGPRLDRSVVQDLELAP